MFMQRSYTKVKGHLRSGCEMKNAENVKMASFEKLKSDLNPTVGIYISC